MPVFISHDIPDNETLRDFGGGLLPTTLSQTLSETISDPLLRPTQMLATQTAVAEEEGFFGLEPELRGRDVKTQEDLDRLLGEGALRPLQHKRLSLTMSGLSPLDDVQTLTDRYSDVEGLTFDKPTRRAAAEIIAQGKREENIRNDVISRGPQGFVPGVAKFGASLLGAAIDPLNIASAFIPVVGEARLGALTARLGANAARAVKGGAEGLVGGALVEPLTYALAQEQQLDYEMSDAILNMSLGGLLGGGLHVAGGKIGDFIAKRSPQAREDALRAAVAQAADGRRVDVEAIFRADQQLRSRLRDSTAIPARAFDEGQIRRIVSQEVGEQVGAPKAQSTQEVGVSAPASVLLPSTSKKGAVRIFDTEKQAIAATKKMRADVVPREMRDGRFMLALKREGVDVYREGGDVKKFKTKRQADKFIKNTGQKKASVIPVGEAGKRSYAVAYNLTDRDLTAINTAPEMVEFQPQTRARLDTLPKDISLPFELETGVRPRSATEQMAREFNPERDPLADFDSSASAARISVVDLDPTDERAFRASFVEEMRARGVLDEADEIAMAEAQEGLDRAKSVSDGAEAAAYCVGRNS